MEGINEAVLRQLKEQKCGKDILRLWDKLWKSYQQDGIGGVDEFLSRLLEPSGEKE